MFYNREVNKAGCYLVYFYVNGVKTGIMVDDFFPVYFDKDIAFAKNKGNEFWVCILEKAWAKLHGSYAKIEEGRTAHAFNHLSGIPAYSEYNHKDVTD